MPIHHTPPPPAGVGESAVVLEGIGAALAPQVVSNDELCARLDTTDEWIRTRTGISHRRIAGAGVSTEDLAAAAAADALSSSGGHRVQALVLATTTPDRRCPATAPTVASRLDLNDIPAMDLAAGCAGFLYALAAAAGFIASGAAEVVLVIGADRLSTLPDPEDRSTVPLFGDAAGAAVLRRGVNSEPGAIGPMVLGSDGAHHDLITAGHTAPLRMQGAEVFRHAVERMATASAHAAQAAGWSMAEVDRLVPHQANARITDFLARTLGIPEEHQVHNVAHVGNTGAASIPVLLAQAATDGRIAAGHRVLLTAFGAGLTWGATTLTWPDITTRHRSHP